MKWEDYKEQETNRFKEMPPGNWVKTNIECPVCGELVYKNVGLVLACYPPKYQYRCVKCDWFDTWY